MMKSKELSDQNSCFNKAASTEIIFVLLARDKAAPVAIRSWCNERIRIGKNQPNDTQIFEALECASRMERLNQFL